MTSINSSQNACLWNSVRFSGNIKANHKELKYMHKYAVLNYEKTKSFIFLNNSTTKLKCPTSSAKNETLNDNIHDKICTQIP